MMLISLCTPSMNRKRALKKCLQSRIKAANNSPPVEIVILDYNSTDGLKRYIKNIKKSKPFVEGNFLTYQRYTGRNYYHLAHAWNLAAKASKGDYIVIFGTDAFLHEDFFSFIREAIEKHQYEWMSVGRQNGTIVCKRQVFMDIGGYDENFEYYGSEDKDIIRRLKHGGFKRGVIPGNLRKITYTYNKDKIKNYRGNLTKKEMMVLNADIRHENEKKNILIANQGKEWGQM